MAQGKVDVFEVIFTFLHDSQIIFHLSSRKAMSALQLQYRRAPRPTSSCFARMLRGFPTNFWGDFQPLCKGVYRTCLRALHLQASLRMEVRTLGPEPMQWCSQWKYAVYKMCWDAPTHMRPLVSSRYPGLQMHLKLPSSFMHSPFKHMFLIRHSSWSVEEKKEHSADLSKITVCCGRNSNTYRWTLNQGQPVTWGK